MQIYEWKPVSAHREIEKLTNNGESQANTVTSRLKGAIIESIWKLQNMRMQNCCQHAVLRAKLNAMRVMNQDCFRKIDIE